MLVQGVKVFGMKTNNQCSDMSIELPALLGKYIRPTDQPTNRQTGKVTLPRNDPDEQETKQKINKD